jgi:hypothetical protein
MPGRFTDCGTGQARSGHSAVAAAQLAARALPAGAGTPAMPDDPERSQG